VRRAALLVALLTSAGTASLAQTGTRQEGAPELVLQIGARTMAMGQAAVAASEGTEGVWANPALIARARREVSFDVRNQANPAEPNSNVALVGVIPGPPVGSMAVFLRYINNGAQPGTTGPDNTTSEFTPLSYVIGASFATTFNRFALGFTAKELLIRFSCTGDCSQSDPGGRPSVTALDFGAQYFVFGDSSLSLGASVLNLGPKLQIIDAPQADPLPSRGLLGFVYAPVITSVPDVRVRLGGDVVTRLLGGESVGLRFGGEVSYLDRYQLRAGYMTNPAEGTDSPTIGFGLTSGRVHIDLAQIMTNRGALGTKPTFLTLHFRF
jgi:hypothetical protein